MMGSYLDCLNSNATNETLLGVGINIITNQLHTTDCLQSPVNNLLHISSRYEKKVKHERLEIVIILAKGIKQILSKSKKTITISR
ncbi:hypothetical protein [Aquimarina macrocephali]|uniref:hypothetical protein n=1 Tax=Aquimarina macrocephali TaxID=666563 RepID=UPI003F665C8B